jgi:hypothetical protein
VQALTYAPTVAPLRDASLPALQVARFVCDLLFRHILHSIICCVVLATPRIWSSPVYYLLASNGMLYINWINARLLLASPEGAWLAKKSAQLPHPGGASWREQR